MKTPEPRPDRFLLRQMVQGFEWTTCSMDQSMSTTLPFESEVCVPF
jgi:hypothetical protein